jgi:hypothetical protein
MNILDPNGNPLPQAEIQEYSTLQWDDVIPAAFRHSKENHSTIDPQKSLYDFFLERSKTMFQTHPPEIAEQKRSTFLQIAAGWGAYIGSPITQQSLKFFWLEECLEGENPFVAGTYSKILDAVAETAKNHADIRLNCEVVEIRSHRMIGEASVRPFVKLADGDSLLFDEVVVTTPLGWLKGNKAAFMPALPAELSLAIDSISYGHLDKVYLTFPSAWWNQPYPQEHTSSSDEDGKVMYPKKHIRTRAAY